MNEDPQYCQKILALLANRAALATIGEVIQILQDLNEMLLSSDGVKWFNMLVLDRLTGLASRGLLTTV